MTIQDAWFQKKKWLWVLLPFTLLFYGLSALRRALYKYQILSSYQPQIPLVVVGNIGIGGNGKTPVILALIDYFQSQNKQVAVLSRGYGGECKSFPYSVRTDSPARLVGDEPALIKRRYDCDLVIDPVRVRGCQFIEEKFKPDVILCDDGLQHYALGRDIEICVIDNRGLGNAKLLPMGPLREGAWRLLNVDYNLLNLGFGTAKSDSVKALMPYMTNASEFTIKPNAWVNLITKQRIAVDDFSVPKVLNVIALAGIGDPKKFFVTLDRLSLAYDKCLPFDDHHVFVKEDIPDQHHCVLMTEKDAVKIRPFAHKHCWYLEINAKLEPELFSDLLTRLFDKEP